MDWGQFLQEQWLILGVSFVLGAVAKKSIKAAEAMSGVKVIIGTKVVPVITFIVTVIGNALAPASAHAAAIVDKALGAEGAGVLLNSIATNLIITGAHSQFKNTVKPALMSTFKWLALQILMRLAPKS